MKLIKERTMHFKWSTGLENRNPKLTGRWKIRKQGHNTILFVEVEYDTYPEGFIPLIKDLFGSPVIVRKCGWIHEDSIFFSEPIYEAIYECAPCH